MPSDWQILKRKTWSNSWMVAGRHVQTWTQSREAPLLLPRLQKNQIKRNTVYISATTKTPLTCPSMLKFIFSGCSFFSSHNQNNHLNSQIPENVFGTEFASSLSASFSLVSLQDSELNSETKFNGCRGAEPPYHHNTTTKRRQTFSKLPCHKMESFIVFSSGPVQLHKLHSKMQSFGRALIRKLCWAINIQLLLEPETQIFTEHLQLTTSSKWKVHTPQKPHLVCFLYLDELFQIFSQTLRSSGET